MSRLNEARRDLPTRRWLPQLTVIKAVHIIELRDAVFTLESS